MSGAVLVSRVLRALRVRHYEFGTTKPALSFLLGIGQALGHKPHRAF